MPPRNGGVLRAQSAHAGLDRRLLASIDIAEPVHAIVRAYHELNTKPVLRSSACAGAHRPVARAVRESPLPGSARTPGIPIAPLRDVNETDGTHDTMPDPRRTARSRGLRYVDDATDGIRRRRCGRGCAYYLPGGALIRSGELRSRIEALAIPPAWTDVWICPTPDGHLQATGRDDRGRKQYVYHEEFRRAREAEKFERLPIFGHGLPRLRRRVGRDLAREGLPREKVLGAGVRLLDRAAIRVGADAYERENGSFGLTTLRRRHLSLNGKAARLRFEGKGGKDIEIRLSDPDLIDVLRECDELPGYRIFQYVEPDGTKRTVEASEVNRYLRESIEADVTAKDFRTWAGTVRAVGFLARHATARTDDERTTALREAIRDVSEHLHNTPAVSRDSYVHPRVMELFEAGGFAAALRRARRRERRYRTPGRRRNERLVLALLDARDGSQ